MLKRYCWIPALLIAVLTIGCWNDLESYALGRGMYYTLEANLKPETVGKLEDRYNQTLDEIASVTIVTPTQIMSLFNDMALIMTADIKNPYGLMGDLSEFFRGAGAEFAEDGSMIDVRPITAAQLRAFSRGWKNSKADLNARSSN